VNISIFKKKDFRIINFIFLLIPIIFLFPVNISNIFCIIYLAITLYFLKKNNLKIKIDIIDVLLLFFFLIITISSLKEISIGSEFAIKKLTFDILTKIVILRFFLIYLLTKNILLYKLVRIDTFFRVSAYCAIFISINILLMHVIGNDLFGNKAFAGYRFSTIFGERAIAGTYLLNFFFFGLVYFYYVYKRNNLIKFFFIILVGFGILLSFDRAPFILFLVFYPLICLLNIKKDYKLIIIGILILPIFYFLIIKYEGLFARYSTLVHFEAKKLTELSTNKTNENNISQYTYASIYKDSINTIFFEKTLFGSGKSSFYSRCRDYRLQTDIKSIIYGYVYACPKHTHHLYLEILISGGILCFFIFLIVIIINLNLLTKNILQKKNSPYYTINSILLTAFIVEVFPLRSYGEIFNSYNGLFFFFKISIIYGIIKFNLLRLNLKYKLI